MGLHMVTMSEAKLKQCVSGEGLINFCLELNAEEGLTGMFTCTPLSQDDEVRVF